MKDKLISVEDAKDKITKALGEPALLDTEDYAVYEALIEGLVQSVGPNNIFKLINIRLVVDDVLEMLRNRQLQAKLVQNTFISVNCEEMVRFGKGQIQISSLITAAHKRYLAGIKHFEYLTWKGGFRGFEAQNEKEIASPPLHGGLVDV
jgi:hypothetical protein